MNNLFINCLEVVEKDGWYTPRRFTEKQLSVYREEADSFRIRSLAPSSCCLAFYTAARSIEIEYRLGDRARDWASFDVVTDGILTDTVEVKDESGVVTLELSGDEKKETHVYLPHLLCVEIKIKKSDAPLVPVKKKEKLWLAIGDSITQGMVARRASSAYPSVISEFYGCEVINQGVGGIHFEAGELDFIGREPDLITVALGCNDWGLFTDGELEAKVDEYVRGLLSLYSTENIYFILPIWRSDELTREAKHRFREHIEIIRGVIEKYPSVKIIDGYGLLPHVTDIYNDPSKGQIHPNDEGFFLYSLALMRKLPRELFI